MKSTTLSKLTLKKTTIRMLNKDEAALVAGGVIRSRDGQCSDSCTTNGPAKTCTTVGQP